MENYQFHLPDVGEGVAEAEIVAWHVKAGDKLDEDQLMVDVMTDKATVEMTAPVAGRVIAVHGEVGQRVPVGSVLVELDIGAQQPSVSVALAQAISTNSTTEQRGSDKEAPVAPEPQAETLARSRIEPSAISSNAAYRIRPLASPATRRRAYELGVELENVPGSGPAGRITRGDLDAFATSSNSAPEIGKRARRGRVTETKIVGMRRKIAENMVLSKSRIPHFTYVEEFDLTELERLRRQLNTEGNGQRPRLTLLPFFMCALVKLVPEFPQVNARYDDEAGILHCHEALHIGIATQTPNGLMVPVIQHVEALNIFECAAELSRVTAAARQGKVSRSELTGSTITLTSLGTLGGIAATPVINYPEVAIIGPNKLVDRPIMANGQITVRTMMNLSASFDHRIVDGYDAARLVQALKRLIEQPALIFMDGA